MKTQNKVRATALLTGGILALTSLSATSAQAKVSRKQYKIGAAVLGVLGVILAAKGKTVPAVIVGAGAYYAYKKGQETHDDVYPTRRDRQARNTSKRDDNANYDDSYGNANYGNANYDNANYDDNADTSCNTDDRYAQNTDSGNVYPDAFASREKVAAKVARIETRDANRDYSENDVSID